MPTIQCLIPSSLMDHSNQQATVELEAADVADVLQQLVYRYPGLKPHLLDESQNLLPHIQLYVNQDHIRDRDGVRTRCAAGDEILLLPALAGG